MSEDVWLFSYGTLRQPEVQESLFGRVVATEADALTGFRLASVRITDPAVIATSGSDVHPMLVRGDGAARVEGVALRLTPAELAAADAYEVDAYVRVAVTLASGRAAFAYIARAADQAASSAS